MGASTHEPHRSHPFTQIFGSLRMPEKAVRLFSHPEILPLGRCTHSLEPWPLESLKRENGSTSWKKGDLGTVLMLGGRAPRKAVRSRPCGRRQSWLFWAEEGQCSPLSCLRVGEPSPDMPVLMPLGELRYAWARGDVLRQCSLCWPPGKQVREGQPVDASSLQRASKADTKSTLHSAPHSSQRPALPRALQRIQPLRSHILAIS